jgi:chorismate synthase
VPARRRQGWPPAAWRRKLLAEFGVEISSAVYRIGAVAYPKEQAALDAAKADESDVRCPDPDVSERMKAEIDAARYARDALGGEFVVVARGCPRDSAPT